MALVSTLAGRGFRTLSSVGVFLVGACPACLGDLLVGTALPELSLVLRLLRGLAGLVPVRVPACTRSGCHPVALGQQCLCAPSLLVVRLLRGPWLPCKLLSRRPHTGPCLAL